MKKINRNLLVLVMVAVITVMFAVNVHQGYRYERFLFDTRLNEREQAKWFEENKKKLSVLSVKNHEASSLAAEMGLSGTKAGQTIIIDTRSREESNGEWKE